MAVPYTFGNATTSIPLSQLDSNFATAITIGNTAVYLGNTTTSFGNVTLTNVTISSGNATVTKITAPTHDAGSGNALTLQSNSTTGLYIDTSQNVGIGTTSPSTKLEVSGGITASGGNVIKATAGVNIDRSGNDAYLWLQQSSAGGGQIRSIAAGGFKFTDNGAATEWMRIDSSGNVGIGTSSPVYTLDVQSATPALRVLSTTGTSNANLRLQNNGGNTYLFRDNSTGSDFSNVAYASGIYCSGAYPFILYTAATERMRIDSSGNLLVGTTTTGSSNSNSFTFEPANKYAVFNHANAVASGTGYAFFSYNGAAIGSITQNGTTGVLYNITSDYRLKDNPTKITNGIETIQKLNPVNFTWKTDNSSDSGFIAHEFQSVIPRSVTGEKDAVDANGKPVYQGMDNSGAIPYLVAAIQELKAELDALKGTK